MATLVDGPEGFRWEGGDEDDAGYRTYKVSFLVECDTDEGPQAAREADGLPQIGDSYQFGADFDEWVWCRPEFTAKPEMTDGGNIFFRLTFTFSNKPVDYKIQRCFENPTIQDPTLEPFKISGNSHKDKEEAVFDRFWEPILNSAWEPVHGKVVEFDIHYSTVEIEMNRYILNLEQIDRFMNTVNFEPLWGYPERCVKLSDRKFKRAFFGVCSIYFTITLIFEIKVKIDPETGAKYSGWDRRILDEGTRVMYGHWDRSTGLWFSDLINGQAPNPDNPAHFIRYKDPQGQDTRVLLDGRGMPLQNAPPLVTGCSIQAIVITNGGTGYQGAPGVTLAVQRGFEGQGAELLSTVTGGAVTAITVRRPGFGYVPGIPPLVNITGGNGTGATAVAVLSPPAGCDQCPSVFPLFYRVTGMVSNEFGPLAVFNTVLVYVSGCTWQGNAASPNQALQVTLTYDPVSTRWLLTTPAGHIVPPTGGTTQVGSYTWETFAIDWGCKGPNVMVEVSGTLQDILVTSAGNTKPFYFFVEYYDESDFLELDIPADLTTPAFDGA